MKKFVSVFVAFVLAFSGIVALSGCSKNNNSKFDLVFITDGASVDDNGYNENAWNGVKSFAEENEMTCRYYQPALDDEGNLNNETIKNYIDLAVNDGAKYVVVQGDKFSSAMGTIAPDYAETNFLLVGSVPAATVDNVMTISFNNVEAGILAGCAAVSKGMTKLGYFGSTNEKASIEYGSGFLQGASYCADEKGIPVTLDYADYDAKDLTFDYSFTIRPIYIPVEEEKEQTFKVNVIDGIGSGVYTDGENVTIIANPAPEGKAFDHWEKKSDTDGVKDKKVNISSTKKDTINLVVGDCDCTLTAVWKDADTVPVDIALDASKVVATYNAEKNSSVWVTAPAATSGKTFDHWETETPDAVDDLNSAETNVNVADSRIVLTPVYAESDIPTFDVTVENGTGSGSYKSGDHIELVADAPADGMMFYKWENVDNQGLSTGISMDNEYCYKTSFDMVDRYSAITETMFNRGTQVIFGGGNSQSISIFSSTWEISHQVYGFGWGIDESDMGNCLASVVNDYRVAIVNALKEYKGGSNYEGNCANGSIYVTGISTNETYTDDDGNEVKDENYDAIYAKLYNALADGTFLIKDANGDIKTIGNSKCLTLNHWVQ